MLLLLLLLLLLCAKCDAQRAPTTKAAHCCVS